MACILRYIDMSIFIRGRAPCRKHDGWAQPFTRSVKKKQKVSHRAQINGCYQGQGPAAESREGPAVPVA